MWGVRGGKSSLAARIAEAEGALPGARVWCVAPTYDLADKVFREVWDSYRERGWLLPGSTNSRQAGRIVRPWGGFIERKSADNPDSLVGEALDRIILDEAARCKASVWERELRPRLSDRRGRAFLITTPAGQDWIYDAYTLWQKGSAPGWHWTNSPTWDNVAVFPGGRDDPEIVAARDYYAALGLDELFAQEYGAEFTVVRGRVFKRWDRATMVVPRAEARAGVNQWWLGYDWGWDHPAVWALLGRTSGGDWRILDEDYGTGEAPDEILARAMALLVRNGLTPERIERLYYDPSRPEQGAAFRRAGLPASPAAYTLPERITAIAAALARPRGLLVADCCTRIPVELSNYRHPDDYRGGDVRVVKRGDDGVDAVAGVLASIARGEGASIPVAYARR